ncbi:hypothetical protein Tco_1261542, partial [Tanacetum coccineum]
PKSSSLGLAACASLESKSEVCLLCEGRSMGDIQVVPGFVGQERRLFGEVAVLSPQVV